MKKSHEENLELFAGEELDSGAILNNLEALSEIEQSRWPQRLIEMIAIVESALKRLHNIEAQRAQRQAQDVVVAIARHFGGHQIYLPFGTQLECAIRDAGIWREFTGRNIEELAKRHKLSAAMIYLIIARQRKLHTKKIQGSLFEE